MVINIILNNNDNADNDNADNYNEDNDNESNDNKDSYNEDVGWQCSNHYVCAFTNSSLR